MAAGEPTQEDTEDDILLSFDGLGSSVVSDALDRLGLPSAVLHPSVARMSGDKVMGRARTVARIPRPVNTSQNEVASELGTGTQQVIDSCKPGDVIVVAAGGDLSAAMVGGNLCNRARYCGAVGVVTDGAIRDRDELSEMGLAVFASGLSPRQAVGRLVTVSINEPVVCGGVRICPGDIVIGDADGVVVVSRDSAKQVSEEAHILEGLEGKVANHINSGSTLVDAVAKYKVR